MRRKPSLKSARAIARVVRVLNAMLLFAFVAGALICCVAALARQDNPSPTAGLTAPQSFAAGDAFYSWDEEPFSYGAPDPSGATVHNRKAPIWVIVIFGATVTTLIAWDKILRIGDHRDSLERIERQQRLGIVSKERVPRPYVFHPIVDVVFFAWSAITLPYGVYQGVFGVDPPAEELFSSDASGAMGRGAERQCCDFSVWVLVAIGATITALIAWQKTARIRDHLERMAQLERSSVASTERAPKTYVFGDTADIVFFTWSATTLTHWVYHGVRGMLG